ncbi:MAG: hypothetical protein ACLFTJ_12695 [Halothece sp.]
MKCVQCGTDNNLKDRTENNGQCKECNHPFAFEPQNEEIKLRFTDPFFANAIRQLSNDDSLYFTSKQLRYFLDKRLKNKSSINVGGLVIAYFILGIFISWILGATFIHLSFALGFKVNTYLVVLLIYNLFAIVLIYGMTESSLTTIVERRNHSRLLQVIGFFSLVGLSFILLFIIPSPMFFSISVILGGLSLILGTKQLNRSRFLPQNLIIPQEKLENWITRWESANGKIEKLLTPLGKESNEDTTETPRELNPEITNYSFDRAVICDRAEIARFLIANNFHFENNCAVLSVTGYPKDIFSTVLEMLKSNPNLKVYALHNCNPRGIQLNHHLATSPNWFKDERVNIYDVGILPRQVFNGGDFFIRNSPQSGEEAKQIPQEIKDKLLPEELEWLEKGNLIELESLSPRRIIQTVTQAINNSRQLEMTGESLGGDSGEIDAAESYILISSFEEDNTRSSFFASDSFG